MSRFSNSNNYPLDWKCFRFDQLFNFEGGLSISRENLSDEGICYLHYGDIHTSTENYIDVKKDYDKLPKYNEKLQNINQKYLLNDGDIVIADASEDYEGIGKAVVIFNEENIPFISGLHTIVAKDKTDLIYRDFKRYFLSDWYIRKQMMFYATGISVFGLSKENVKKIQVILPSKLEQQKIADILSTWDKAIELKEKLIEQKKEQKKGLMQRLLTGKVRLPGFKGEWKEVRLGSIGSAYNGLTGKNKEDFGSGKPYIPYKSVFNGSRINIDQLEYVQISETENQNKVKYGDIIFTASSETPEEVGMSSVLLDHVDELYLNSFCFGYRLNDFNTLIPEFAQYLFRGNVFRKELLKLAQGSTRFNLSKNEVLKIKIKIPGLEEQKKIAFVLTIFDREIDLLEQELEALKQQKKGLMQLLLTGKVRVKC